jgi:hypothetical protein
MTKGFGRPLDFFDQFHSTDILGGHRETGRYHVSILDDHDMVGNPKRRYAAGATGVPNCYEQVAHAVGTMLTTLGIPCIYYGTEQALDGSQDRHDFSIEANLSFEDRYIREVMFGGVFGAFGTSGCHFFNPNHPSYLRIAAIAEVRNRQDKVGLALRRGRQFLRDTSVDGRPFAVPGAGELTAWSRLMFDTEVVVALNTHSLEPRAAYVTVDGVLNPPGKLLRVFYRGDWPDRDLRTPPTNECLTVEAVQGRAAVRVELPPAGMMILA